MIGGSLPRELSRAGLRQLADQVDPLDQHDRNREANAAGGLGSAQTRVCELFGAARARWDPNGLSEVRLLGLGSGDVDREGGEALGQRIGARLDLLLHLHGGIS